MTPPVPAPRGPRVPLRVTLVALLVALVAFALLATGFAATSLLRGYLLDQQDEELQANIQAQRPTLVRLCIEPGYPQPTPFYVACLTPDSDEPVVLGEPQGPDGDELPELSAREVDQLREHSRPISVWADGEQWRMAAGELPGGYTLVVGSDLEGDRKAIARLVRIEVVVGLIVLTVLGVAGYVLVRNSLRPLEEVGDTARAIAAGDLSRRVPAGDGRTEVGRLSAALNGMLARIESAFSAQRASEEQARASEGRMRRFVADASHELRTPLTSIRGFAELYRQGAVRDPEDVARLMQRIEAEGGRMGLLVEDLLQLARLDQQRPLAVTPVDLAEVAGDVVHDARALQPDRPVELVVDPAMTELPVVLGDEARLRQVLGNLVTNALVHTPADARVTVTLAEEPAPPGAEEDGGTVVVRVADEGPGMTPEDAARVFERFYRADPSRHRAAGGTGLGLAIVSSLVAAHGGTVRLDTAPGQGAVFTVRLPRSGPPEQAGVPG
ncbi:cell wall metabolism sensor histidine kinase WalK [Blastococcus sp. TF02A-26]|uniref:sensor histidine kinase n=1 Tax=Blastococcus sp. TF02A-26 TaxID=2250577 RepID=UPI000DEC0192|nr:HAMP domain-containing sensor histidine kinase [Blastococcus sp. TF02A-26]RBY81902.1 sensor histidine kinase [Blastococcus sp. TF02A-26]